ncbi:MAG: hypothetical protein HY367_01935 [Candidatus Aenigmarchaeota archaeon]|nr:hypothetical protein [Candidatus Aenigmarchaeota archaeon]
MGNIVSISSGELRKHVGKTVETGLSCFPYMIGKLEEGKEKGVFYVNGHATYDSAPGVPIRRRERIDQRAVRDGYMINIIGQYDAHYSENWRRISL